MASRAFFSSARSIFWLPTPYFGAGPLRSEKRRKRWLCAFGLLLPLSRRWAPRHRPTLSLLTSQICALARPGSSSPRHTRPPLRPSISNLTTIAAPTVVTTLHHQWSQHRAAGADRPGCDGRSDLASRWPCRPPSIWWPLDLPSSYPPNQTRPLIQSRSRSCSLTGSQAGVPLLPVLALRRVPRCVSLFFHSNGQLPRSSSTSSSIGSQTAHNCEHGRVRRYPSLSLVLLNSL